MAQLHWVKIREPPKKKQNWQLLGDCTESYYILWPIGSRCSDQLVAQRLQALHAQSLGGNFLSQGNCISVFVGDDQSPNNSNPNWTDYNHSDIGKAFQIIMGNSQMQANFQDIAINLIHFTPISTIHLWHTSLHERTWLSWLPTGSILVIFLYKNEAAENLCQFAFKSLSCNNQVSICGGLKE